MGAEGEKAPFACAGWRSGSAGGVFSAVLVVIRCICTEWGTTWWQTLNRRKRCHRKVQNIPSLPHSLPFPTGNKVKIKLLNRLVNIHQVMNVTQEKFWDKKAVVG